MTPDALAALHDAAFVNDRAWSADEFRAMLDSPHCHLTEASHGFALWRAVAREAELMTIAIHPDQRRKGYGAALMQTWMTAAHALADTAFLEVAEDNTAAIALYTAFGFEAIGRRPGYYARFVTYVDGLVMRAPLPFSDLKKTSGD